MSLFNEPNFNEIVVCAYALSAQVLKSTSNCGNGQILLDLFQIYFGRSYKVLNIADCFEINIRLDM